MYTKILVFLFINFFYFFSLLALASDPDPIQDFCIPNTKKSKSIFLSPCKNSKLVTPDDFVFSRLKPPENFTDTGLAAVSVNPSIFPGLNTLGMSFVHVDLNISGINPPHFHPRATEIAYILRGKVYSGFVDSSNRVFSKVIGPGDVMIFPKGLVHFMMNVGETPATIFGCFNSQNPGNVKIPSTIFGSGINDELLEKAFGLNIKQIVVMRRKFFPKKIKR
ncbi:germin-like protein subfamily 3 member 2 [Capsicum galapagoense]